MSVWLTKLIWQDGLAILGRGQYLRNKRLLGKHSNPSVIENYLLYSLHGEILVKASMFVNLRRPVRRMTNLILICLGCQDISPTRSPLGRVPRQLPLGCR